MKTIKIGNITIECDSNVEIIIEGDKVTVKAKGQDIHYHYSNSSLPFITSTSPQYTPIIYCNSQVLMG